MTKLKEYLDKYGIAIRAFARRCNCSSATIHKIINGDRSPSLEIAIAIEKTTEGCIKVYDLVKKKSSTEEKKKKLKCLDKKGKE